MTLESIDISATSEASQNSEPPATPTPVCADGIPTMEHTESEDSEDDSD